MSVTDRIGNFLLTRTSRRSFIARSAMTATALSVAPVDFMLKPGTAYAQICECVPGTDCGCSSTCCDGYTQFCCTINNGINACPSGTFAGGWWKADGSIYCDGPRYYIDCMGVCSGCGCGGGVFCPSCDGLNCECALGNCNNFHIGCAEFRYGQCNQEIGCSGRIACRVVSCTPPWLIDSTCSTVAQTDDTTANQEVSSAAAPAPSVAFGLLPGFATDIAIGANGSVWIVGTNPAPSGFGIYSWIGGKWTEVAGGAVSIAVGRDGAPWVINSSHQIFHWTGSGWALYPGSAGDIAVGANGSVWIVGTNAVNGGYGIYEWNGRAWGEVPGGAVSIAVGPDGAPWVINSSHQIFHWTGSGWALYPGSARDIAVGANGSVWIVGTNAVNGGYGIYLWNGRAWGEASGGAAAIAASPNGSPWVVNSSHQIWAG